MKKLSTTLMLLVCMASLAIAQQKARPLLQKVDSLEKLLSKNKQDYDLRHTIADTYNEVAEEYLDYNNFTHARLVYNRSVEARYNLKKFYKKRSKPFARRLQKKRADMPYEGLMDIADFYQELAQGFLESDSLHEARRLFQKTGAIARIVQNSELDTSSQLRLADTYVAMRSWGKARKVYSQLFPSDRKNYPDTVRMLQEALQLWCVVRQQNNEETWPYRTASSIFSVLHHMSKDEGRASDYAFMAARGYWNAREMSSSEYWYKKVLSEDLIDSLVNDNKFYIVKTGHEFCETDPVKFRFYLRDNRNLDYFYYTQLLLNGRGDYAHIRPLLYRFRLVDVHDREQKEREPFMPGATFLVQEAKTRVNSDISNEYAPMVYMDSLLLFVSDSFAIAREQALLAKKPDSLQLARLGGEDNQAAMQLMSTPLNREDYQIMNVVTETAGFELYNDAPSEPFLDIPRKVLYREGPPVFLDEKSSHLIYTGNSFEDEEAIVKNGGINTLRMFIAKKDTAEETGWHTREIEFRGPNARLFNDRRYSTGHPALTKDQKYLYFSSDVPVGEGNSDLYVAKFNLDSAICYDITNLGPVNSEGNDLFPSIYIEPENGREILLFSSNRTGPDAVGGLDIYFSEKLRGYASFSTPQNFQVRTWGKDDCNGCINSEKDDFGLYMNPRATAGFFASDRKGTDDIYRFRIVKLQVTVVDSLNPEIIIPCAEVKLRGADGEILQTLTSDAETGTVTFTRFDIEQNYRAIASKECCPDSEAGAAGCEGNCNLDNCYRPGHTEVYTGVENLPIDGIIRDTIRLRYSPKADLVVLANVKSEQQVFLSFDKEVYELNNENRLPPGELFELFYDENNGNHLSSTSNSERGYIGIRDNPQLRIEAMEEKGQQQKLFAMLRGYGIREGDVTIIRNIRYGFAQAQFSEGKNEEVNPEAQFKKLAGVMNKFDHLILKVTSHTDSCPEFPGVYDNKALSGRRNRAAVKSITENMLNTAGPLPPEAGESGEEKLLWFTRRIKTCAYTYEYPVDNENSNGCKNDFNRRTEFKLLYSWRDGYMEDSMCNPEMVFSINRDELEQKRQNTSGTSQANGQ